MHSLYEHEIMKTRTQSGNLRFPPQYEFRILMYLVERYLYRRFGEGARVVEIPEAIWQTRVDQYLRVDVTHLWRQVVSPNVTLHLSYSAEEQLFQLFIYFLPYDSVIRSWALSERKSA
jgi:hypothetical protein